MTQNPRKLINLSVHESSDLSVISPNPDTETSSALNDLNDSSHDDENVDVPTPGLTDAGTEENIVERQNTIANLSAG